MGMKRIPSYKNAPEREVIGPLVEFLERLGIPYYRANTIRPKTVNGKTFFARVAPSQRGAPDLFIFPPFNPPRFIAAECKAANRGGLSTFQMFWKEKIEAVGGCYIVVRDPLKFIGFYRQREKIEWKKKKGCPDPMSEGARNV